MKNLGAIIWFVLCAAMAIGMVFFAVLYIVTAFIFKKLAWRSVPTLSSFKFAK
jgi:hypothetical protein